MQGRRAVWFSVCLATAACSLASVLLMFAGCQTVPMTARKRLLLVPEGTENQMGLTAYQEVLKTEKLSTNESAAAMVKRVGQRIAAVSDRPDFAWEFNVIESDTQNAFCLPGGKVAVYTGILPICESEAGLAVVMAHEVAHAIARHGGERMTMQMGTNGVKKAGGYLMRNVEEQKQKIVLAAYGVGTEYGVLLPYSRKHELEADHIGILLMARAGYDPSEAPRFWERFAQIKTGTAPIEFLSTHPSDATRSAALRGLLPEAMREYETAKMQFGLGEPIPK
jgi:predicted Zn-dependent protease